MTKYRILWVRGDYRARQLEANAAKAVLYVEHHFNALERDKVGPEDNPTLAIVLEGAPEPAEAFGRSYVARVCKEFGTRSGGLIRDPARGGANLRHLTIPGVLLEPLFVSDEGQAAIAKSPDGQTRLAHCLAATIFEHFPAGGTVAFSVGHKYKTTRPLDRGAPVFGGGNEADLAEAVLLRAASLLLEIAP